MKNNPRNYSYEIKQNFNDALGLHDEYDQLNIDPNVMYTTENIPTADTQDDFKEISTGCECTSNCSVELSCKCLNNSRNYSFELFDKKVESIQFYYQVARSVGPKYECNTFCKCSQFCSNRLVQYGPRKNLKVVKCKPVRRTICHDLGLAKSDKKNEMSKGFGLFTAAPIRHGNFICEYAGEVISQKEANIRYKKQETEKSMNYILCVNENFGENILKTFVDPTKFGNIGRYINHSCNPSCEVIPIRVHCTIPKLCVFAKIDINADEEITFDYAGSGNERSQIADSRNDKQRKKCLCGFINCRKFLPFQSTD